VITRRVKVGDRRATGGGGSLVVATGATVRGAPLAAAEDPSGLGRGQIGDELGTVRGRIGDRRACVDAMFTTPRCAAGAAARFLSALPILSVSRPKLARRAWPAGQLVLHPSRPVKVPAEVRVEVRVEAAEASSQLTREVRAVGSPSWSFVLLAPMAPMGGRLWWRPGQRDRSRAGSEGGQRPW
jgi:hypothetical protein